MGDVAELADERERRLDPRIRAVVQAVREEIRTCALLDMPSRPSLPPPHDLDAERDVLGAVLNGQRKPSELPCSATDFYAPLHRAVMAVCESCEETNTPVTAETIAVVLAHDGASVERVAESVADLLAAPWRYAPEHYAARVHELARQRECIDSMARLDAAWRSGLRPAAASFAGLQKLLGRWAP